MLVKIIKDVGSWIPPQEFDLQDEVAKRLIADGRAVEISNKKLKTPEDVILSAQKTNDRINAAGEAAKTEVAEKATAVRNKKTKGE